MQWIPQKMNNHYPKTKNQSDTYSQFRFHQCCSYKDDNKKWDKDPRYIWDFVDQV